MLTEEEFKRLPDCFQQIVEIDRDLAAPVIDFKTGAFLAAQRKVARRMCEITVRQPQSGGLA